jgi:hypothetical protein
LGGGKCYAALSLFAKRGKKFKPWVMVVFLMVNYALNSFGQTPNMCGFDEEFQPVYQSSPQHFDKMESDLQKIIEGINKNGSSPVTIPVVFHIIHQGEPLEIGGNISNAQISNALDSLNADFSNTNISFCMAQRDPNGLPMLEPGIKRVNGSSNGYSGSMSMNGPNEALIKGLSYFTNYRYLNIWVVGDIVGGSGQTVGFASFPNFTANTLDGIVMDKDFLGIGNWHILTHEVGHFLNLYHTFEGDNNGTSCPPLDVTAGDKCADTQAHKRSTNFTCPQGDNECYIDPFYVLSDISDNHMDYSDEGCRMIFSNEQINRMKACLMGPRHGLNNSLGCVPACNPVFYTIVAPINGAFSLNETVTFVSITDLQSPFYSWLINDISVSNDQILTHIFDKAGTYNVCSRIANNNGCSQEQCKIVEIISTTACSASEVSECELLLNGDFSKYNGDFFEFNVVDYEPLGLQSDRICNVVRLGGTPTLITTFDVGNTSNLDVMTLSTNGGVSENGNPEEDKIAFPNPLNLVDGEWYNLSFKYGVLDGEIHPGFYVSFTQDFTSLGAEYIIFQRNNFSGVGQFSLNFNEIIRFQYDDSWGKYLKIGSFYQLLPNPAVLISDIHLSQCCTPNPQIEVTKIDGCTYKFDFDKGIDEGSMFWTIEAGPSGTAGSATQSFVLPGTYEVCLYAQCEGVDKVECIYVKSEGCEIIDCGGILTPTGTQCAGANNATINFTLTLPEGYKPCGENLYMVPAANYSNYFFNDNTNTLQVSANVADPSVSHAIVVCGPNGQQLCYTIGGMGPNGTVCTSCPEITIPVTAVCNDTNTNDLNFSYGGNITITPPAGATPCGVSSSTSGGYSQGTPIPNGPSYTIPFNINTNSPNPFNSEVTICFTINDIKICYKVKIVVSAPCEVEGCLNLASPTLVCSKVNDEIASFNFSDVIGNNLFNGSGWELCSTNGIVLPFGNAANNIKMQTISGYLVDFDLSLPCEEIIKGDPISIILNFCRGNETLCFEYSVSLVCEDCDGKSTIRSRKINEYKIYPSPAANELYAEVPIIKDQYLFLYEISGKLVEKFKVGKGINKLSLNNINSGLYYCKFSEDVDILHKVLITK